MFYLKLELFYVQWILKGLYNGQETLQLGEDERKKKKTRVLSEPTMVSFISNEERLLEYQADLIEQASRHESKQCCIGDNDGNAQEEKTIEEGVIKDDICKGWNYWKIGCVGYL